MEGSMKDLSIYRFEKAENDIKTAEILIREKQFSASVNHSILRPLKHDLCPLKASPVYTPFRSAQSRCPLDVLRPRYAYVFIEHASCFIKRNLEQLFSYSF